MNEPKRRAAELRTLRAKLGHQREVLRAVSARLERAIQRASRGDNLEAVAAAALFLQHYYTAVEDSFLRIAEALDGSVPTGNEWHRLLVEQMTLEIPETRPAVLDVDFARELDVLGRFRHRVRHAYDQDYKWDRMIEPVEAWEAAETNLPLFFDRTDLLLREVIAALDSAG